MENETDPLAQFGLDAIDLRWTLKDIATKRRWMINKQHLAQLIELGLVEYLTIAGRTLPGRLNGDQYCGQYAACVASSRR
jgi:hypothetical protein